jgi:peptide/nickel transport system permease protein
VEILSSIDSDPAGRSAFGGYRGPMGGPMGGPLRGPVRGPIHGMVHGLLDGLLLVIGVTWLSFLLIVHFGPDPSYLLAGPHLTPERLEEIRRQLGLDRSLLAGYLEYLRQLLTLDLGHSILTGESVAAMLARAVPTTIALTVPGFLLGNAIGLWLAFAAARRRGGLMDRSIIAGSALGMSLSFVVIILVLQILLCTPYGLNWFPVRGWATGDPLSYLRHVTVPTLAMVVVSLGYNTRFYRGVLVEEAQRDHVLAQRGLGLSEARIWWRSILPNAAIPILTRLVFSIPMQVVGGSLLIESQFGIPGLGKITFDAITGGDQMVLKAIVGLTAVLFAMVTMSVDGLCRWIDPRIRS